MLLTDDIVLDEIKELHVIHPDRVISVADIIKSLRKKGYVRWTLESWNSASEYIRNVVKDNNLFIID